MKTKIECEQLDRSDWPVGPWDDEPEDRIEWRHLGYPCLMRRNDSGAWCGYVGVPPGHPHHGQDDIYEGALNVHGGVTYASPCQGEICHVPQPGEPHDVFWIGFDCLHAGDEAPYNGALRTLYKAEYRTRDYVKAEVESLAQQLKELEK